MDFSEYIDGLRGKKVTVVGIGISNKPLVWRLIREGIDVCARDKREGLPERAEFEAHGCKVILGDKYLEGIDADVIFRSPGIRPDLPEFSEAVAGGAVLTSEMEAFFEVCPCPIIAVTGSDGKTTTTTVISEILKSAGYTVHIGGNIGKPLFTEADSIKPDDICVLELSSFQLMTMKKSPTVAVITNIAPNHLDIHKDMQEYVDAKKNIFINGPQPAVVVLNADNEITRSLVPLVKNEVRLFSIREKVENGVYLDSGMIISACKEQNLSVMKADDIFIPGMHNVENYMAAFAALRDYVDADDMTDTAKSFGGVEHRIELVRELNGVKYYNDSIASSPSRTTAGLRSFKEKVILIAGGKDKGVSFEPLGAEIKEHVKALVLTGMTAGKIKEAALNAGCDIPIIETEGFKDAVLEAQKLSRPGDVVILSPASTSFDRFTNFEERGRVFKDIVNSLE